MTQPTLKLVGCEADTTPATGRWITPPEAERRSGLNFRHIRRMCLEDWQHRGLAKRDRLPSGQMGWLIDEAADPRFAVAPSVEQRDESFDAGRLGLTEAQTQEVFQRRKIVADWNEAVRASANIGLTEAQVTTQYLAKLTGEGKHVSRATLYNWLRSWRANGIKGLIDSRWKSQRGDSDYSQFMAFLLPLYLTLRKRSLQSCYDSAADAAEQNGWPKPSYGHAHRLVGQLDPAYVALKREGSKHYTAKFEPSIARDYSSINANDWWCSDDTQMDVWVRHGHKADGSPNFVRPFLHAWQDLRSRRIVGWAIIPQSPTTQTVLRAFVAAAIDNGVPRTVYVDNGKHFDSRILQGRTKHQRLRGIDLGRIDGAFGRLLVEGEPIQVVHAWPYHGQSKPIERFFGTMESRFGKLWDTYAGKDVQSKPEDLKRKLESGQAPTLEEFCAAFGAWLEADYNAAPHRGDAMDGQSPNHVFEAAMLRRNVLPRELMEFATFERTRPLKVNKNGVTWRGWSYGQFTPEIARLHGEKIVLALDDRDASDAYACRLDGSLICRVTANGRAGYTTGLDDTAKRDAIREKRRLLRVRKQYDIDRPRMSLDQVEIAVAAARRKNNVPAQAAAQIKTGTDPAPLQPVRTPFDGQLNAIQQASGSKPSMRIADYREDAGLPRQFVYRPAMESEDGDE